MKNRYGGVFTPNFVQILLSNPLLLRTANILLIAFYPNTLYKYVCALQIELTSFLFRHLGGKAMQAFDAPANMFSFYCFIPSITVKHSGRTHTRGLFHLCKQSIGNAHVTAKSPQRSMFHRRAHKYGLKRQPVTPVPGNITCSSCDGWYITF